MSGVESMACFAGLDFRIWACRISAQQCLGFRYARVLICGLSDGSSGNQGLGLRRVEGFFRL